MEVPKGNIPPVFAFPFIQNVSGQKKCNRNNAPAGINIITDDVIIVLVMLPDFFEINETTCATTIDIPMIIAA